LRFGRGFRVIPGNRASQAAERRYKLRAGSLLLITLNFYGPRSRGEK